MGLKVNFCVYSLTQQLLHRASLGPAAIAVDLRDLGGDASVRRSITTVCSI